MDRNQKKNVQEQGEGDTPSCLQVDAPPKPRIQVHLELPHVVADGVQRILQRPNVLLHLGGRDAHHLEGSCGFDLEESVADLVSGGEGEKEC